MDATGPASTENDKKCADVAVGLTAPQGRTAAAVLLMCVACLVSRKKTNKKKNSYCGGKLKAGKLLSASELLRLE